MWTIPLQFCSIFYIGGGMRWNVSLFLLWVCVEVCWIRRDACFAFQFYFYITPEFYIADFTAPTNPKHIFLLFVLTVSFTVIRRELFLFMMAFSWHFLLCFLNVIKFSFLILIYLCCHMQNFPTWGLMSD